MELKFYQCKHCGKIIAVMNESEIPTICCGDEMEELLPGTFDGYMEKHVPVVTQQGDEVTVAVGSVIHPCLEEHYIEWVMLQTDKSSYFRWLKPGCVPKVGFKVMPGEKVQSAYEFCNIHKLWRRS